MAKPLLFADAADGGGGEPPAPTSAAVVTSKPVKTAGKSPREIHYERRLATLEDELGSLKSSHLEVLDFLGKTRAKPAAKPAAGSPSQPKGFLESFLGDVLG